jgi:PAS domain S-box-containing protein
VLNIAAFQGISAEIVPALISFFDADHVCRYANEHHQVWYGRKPEDLIGLHMRSFVGEEGYRSRLPHLERVARGERVSFEATVPQGDGSWRHAAIRYVPHFAQDAFQGFFILVVDIAPQIHRYHRIFDATAVAFWEIDLADLHERLLTLQADGFDPVGFVRDNPDFSREALDRCAVLDINSRAEEMFGVGRDEALAASFGRWCPPESIATFHANLVAYLTGGSGFEGETFMRKSDGTLFPVQISTAFPRQKVQRPAGTFAILDISERVAREQALARANADLAHAARVATLGELTASIAHEVNQPLAAVVTNGKAALRWLGRASPNLEEATLAIQRMIDEGSRAAEIIARTRRMAIKAGSERVPLLLNEVVEEAIAIVRQQLRDLGAEVKLELTSNLPMLVADRVQLQQVVINLVINAAQAMAERSSPVRTVGMRSFSADERVVLEVTDTGPGLGENMSEQIFNAFFTTKSAGMGIGLSISKTIIEAHSGSISARSRSSGGACFRFELPVSM